MVHDTVSVRRLGEQPYLDIWHGMKDFTRNRSECTRDEIWLLQHPPVFTLGQAGREEHLLSPGDIPVVKTDRGGQVTYHGPGQLIAYLMIDLKRKKIGVRELVNGIETSVINLLATYGVEGLTKKGAPGVYVDGAKIAALGLRISKGCSYHGLSLNVNMDLTPFSQINPCGYEGLAVTDLKTLDIPAPMESVADTLSELLMGEFGYDASFKMTRYG